MGKIAEIKNSNQDRTFDLLREQGALYLKVKCSDNKGHSKILKIKVSDVLYQIWNKMTTKEKRTAIRMINTLIAADKKTA